MTDCKLIKVTLTPTDKADSRTRNRIREYNGEFLLLKTRHYEGVQGYHFYDVSRTWSGWFAMDYVDIHYPPNA